MRTGFCFLLGALLLLAACDRTTTSSHVVLLRINELMADNSLACADDDEPNGLALDWIEIFNPTEVGVRLEGYSLTDDPGRPGRYRFPPHLEVPAGGFLVIYLVGDDELERIRVDREARGLPEVVLTDRHADFGLDPDGDTLYLFAGRRQIDRIGWVELPENQSFGRFPDGGSESRRFFAPTPGIANSLLASIAPRFVVSGRPRIELCVPPDEQAVISFRVLTDDRLGDEPLDVRLSLLERPECQLEDQAPERCLQLFAEAGDAVWDLDVEQVGDPQVCPTAFNDAGLPGAPADPTCPSETTDGSFGDATFKVRTYRGLLPRGEELGQSDEGLPTALLWLEIEDSSGCLDFCACHVFGSGCFDVVISEYQPVNPTEEFVCENCRENRGVQTPDWVEIHNFGEDEIDIRDFGLVGRNASRDNPKAWLFGRDTGFDPDYTSIGPGERLVVLADTDGGDLLVERKVFRRVIGRDELGAPILDMSCRYFSAKFALDPRRAREPDLFSLTAPASAGSDTQVIIDEAVLDFRRFFAAAPPAPPDDPNFPIRGLSVIRNMALLRAGDPTPVQCLLPDVDGEWCISLCPSPARCPGSETGANRLDCGQSVELFSELSVRAANAAAGEVRRCPRAGEGVVVTAFATVNNETVRRLEAGEEPSLGVELELEDSLGERFVLSLGAGVGAVPDENRQAEARLGTTLLRLEATIPPQTEGLVQIRRLTVRDEFLADQGDFGGDVAVSDELSPLGFEDSTLSFSYYSGTPPQVDSVVLSEIFPHNDDRPPALRYALPGFDGSSKPDYIELYLPADSSVHSVDLGEYFLTTTSSRDAPIRHPRQYLIPDNTVLVRGGYLVLVAGTLPASPLPRPFAVASIAGFPLAPDVGALYLVGPDRLGNCVVDGISWDRDDVVHPENPSACPPLFPDRQFCYGVDCAGSDVAVQVSPTPGAPNLLPPVLVGASHRTTDTAETRPNLCDALDEVGTMKLSAVVFLDREMVLRFGGPRLQVSASLALARFELSTGIAVGDGRLSATTSNLDVQAPQGYVAAWFAQAVVVPATAGLVTYSVLLEDVCGATPADPCGGSGCFTFFVDGGNPPEIYVNEVNRGYPLPGGGGEGRPWIELYNPSSVGVNLDGFSISSIARVPRTSTSDDVTPPRTFTFDDGTIVPGRGTLLLVTDGGDPLSGQEPPPHVVVDLEWIPEKKLYTRNGPDCESDLRSCGENLEVPGEEPLSAPPVTLFLFERSERGSCLVDSFEARFSDPVCRSMRGLGRDGGGGDIVDVDEPTPGEVSGVSEVTFVRGDVDRDGEVTLTDAVAVLDFLFRAADGPRCLDILDVDDSGRLNVSDAVYLLGYLFRGGDSPRLPFPVAGVDPTPDEIPCDGS